MIASASASSVWRFRGSITLFALAAAPFSFATAGAQECIDCADFLRVEGILDLSGDALGCDVAGEFAYLATGSSGLQIVDVSNPGSPVLAGSVDTPGTATAVTVVGFFAYVADQLSGLQLIDVSNPQSPLIRGSFDTPGSARAVAVAGTLAYVADFWPGLAIYDVSGRLVRTLLSRSTQSSGEKAHEWNGRDDAGHFAPAGAYFARLATGRTVHSTRVLRLR
jgi:hypothetical protein